MQPYFTGSHRQPRRVQISGSNATQKSSSRVLEDARHQRHQRELHRQKEEYAVFIQSRCRCFITQKLLRNENFLEFQNLSLSPFKDYTRLTRLMSFSRFDSPDVIRWIDITNHSLDSFVGLDDSLILLSLLQVIRLDVIDHPSLRPLLLNLSQIPKMKTFLLQVRVISRLVEKLEQVPHDISKSNPMVNNLMDQLSHLIDHFASLDEMLYFLSIPHLPTRIPIAYIARISAILPFNLLLAHSLTLEANNLRSQWSLERRISFVGNLLTFCKARITTWTKDQVNNWLLLLSNEVIALPELSELSKSETKRTVFLDSDDEDNEDLVQLKHGIHPRLLKRLDLLTDKSHITTLITLSNKFSSIRQQLFNYLAITIEKYPHKRDDLIHAILYTPSSSSSSRSVGGPGVIRELWRASVRGSPLARVSLSSPRGFVKFLGKLSERKDDQSNLLSFILLVYLYSRLLVTLPDADFHAPNSPNQALSIDEVISLSSILRNVTFALYTAENIQSDTLPALGFRMMSVRSILTKLARQIHQRDSRKQFTTPGHWLMTSELDLRAFCDAVIAEERKLEDEDSDVEMMDVDMRRGGLRRYRNTKTLSKQQLAQISPKLGILNNIPFVIPFDSRVSVFRELIRYDEIRNNVDSIFDRVKADIRRDNVAEDGFNQLNIPGDQLKGKVFIRFFDQWGNLEAGVDGGGLFKEFLTSLAKEVFDTDRGLWLSNEKRLLYPNPHSYAKEPSQLDWYRFLGKIIGKALYSGILLDIGFAEFFLAKWNGRQSHLDDLASLDPQLYDGLLYLKNYPGDPQDLALTFAASEEEFGVTRTMDLIPNGQNITVTRDNKIQYIHLVSHYRLNTQIEPQCNAFFQGLSSIIDNKWLRMFDQQELGVLIGGAESDIDLDDLKKHTVYNNYSEADEVVINFWSVVRSFNQREKELLLSFVTSCPRAPLLGFRELRPFFAISKALEDDSWLPTASTCVNLLKLPAYSNKEKLRDKLLAAITSGSRFEIT
ncbi:hypothetical protein E3P89_02181 [Wallemia ichthyophaga]|uniref:HECT-type E3 ubiquitin transferase n=1 Tax=Wallemia ichthyophaga TaxID=245174 RepID=A0A4T0I4T8_WALIC|nr:hypothetical protein E3P90_02316 [Wallemia ichthyophaga]TIB13096.1 hypothetical protein E3P93_02076 [Wallemia ichthyophaga]TIB22257.1 hypothetical protein E3P89_02181 [Wallemia ichthyophaga]TIB24009.1 hypothetical protein E3P88_02272 [Wallemia ichthyophaga]